MTGIFGKLFGGKKAKAADGSLDDFLEGLVEGLVEKSGLDLSSEIDFEDDGSVKIEFFGEDEEMLRGREGQLLDAIQLFVKRAVQNQMPDDNPAISVDCDGFRAEANQSLIDLAEKLKGVAVNKGRPVYFRALPPRDRKVIHQYLADDERVKSRSVGEGLYKKIKIYPVKGEPTRELPAEPSGL